MRKAHRLCKAGDKSKDLFDTEIAGIFYTRIPLSCIETDGAWYGGNLDMERVSASVKADLDVLQ